jgi:hypothetical protein
LLLCKNFDFVVHSSEAGGKWDFVLRATVVRNEIFMQMFTSFHTRKKVAGSDLVQVVKHGSEPLRILIFQSRIIAILIGIKNPKLALSFPEGCEPHISKSFVIDI